MKKWLVVILLLGIVSLSCCKKGDLFSLKLVNQKTVIYTQINMTYDHNEFLGVLTKNKNLNDFCEALKISQYKTINNSNYIVLQTTQGLFLVFFDEKGENATLQQIKFSPSQHKNAIINLCSGMTLEDSQKADPDGQFDFLQHSWGDYPEISYHYFEDGDVYCVNYEKGIVVDIVHFTI